jgi:hypothetical protein
MIAAQQDARWCPRRQVPAPGTAEAARAEARRPTLPAEVRYALIAEAGTKPFAFATLADLARSIHRRRRGRTIQLSDRPVHLAGRTSPTPGVTILATDPIGETTTSLGWAYLNGHGWKALASSLQMEE